MCSSDLLLSIPQSVASVSKIACRRSIQKLVAPSRRSNHPEKFCMIIGMEKVEAGNDGRHEDDQVQDQTE